MKENSKEIAKKINNLRNDFESKKIDEKQDSYDFLEKLNSLVQSILGDDSLSLYDLMNEERLTEWSQNRNKTTTWNQLAKTLLGAGLWVKNNTVNILYFSLLATITLFLVSEALNFYAIDGVVSQKTYLKAILTEVCFIFLSGYRSVGWIQMMWVNFLRACIFCLMLFVITSQTIDIGTKTISEISSIEKQMVFVEQQIKEKQKQIAHYKSINWKKNYTRSILEKEELVKKYINLQEKQAAGKNTDVSKVEEYKMYGRAVFRILLLFISALITRRIFKF